MQAFHDNFNAIKAECVKITNDRKDNFNDIPRKRGIWSNSEEKAASEKFLDNNINLTGWIPAWSPGLMDTNYTWLNFPLMGMGRHFENNLKQCPTLSKILKERANIINIAGFSLLTPGATLAEHVDTTGIDYGSMAYHLGLIVPDPLSSTLTVDGEKKIQREGKSMIFESSYLHSAYNFGTKDRVILYIDFKI